MRKLYVGAFAFAAIALLAVSSVSAFGGFGFGSPVVSDEDLEAMQEHGDAVRTAVEEGDYDSWAALMQEDVDKMQARITEENFQEIVSQHEEMAQLREQIQEARKSGDMEAVQEIMEENGLEGHMGKGPGRGMKGGFGEGDCLFAE